MKITDIMIGDWVFVNDVEYLRPLQIGAIKKVSGSHYAHCFDPQDATESCECILTKVVPIEITGRALEASGLRKKERPDGLREWEWISPDGSAVLAVYESEDAPPMVILSHDRPEREHFRVTAAVNHIHQLQHLCNFCSFPLTIKPA